VPAFEDLPRIDVVLITHDHYDHLDRDIIARLGNSPFFIVPLGIGRILGDIGITRYVELDWRDTHMFGGLAFTCTPAQHFSGRGVFDRNRTLWCGWLCRGSKGSWYVAGDTGYFPGFRQIGERYGPIDLTCIPIGAYMPRWFMKPVHLDPQDAVNAFRELGGRYLLPIHYGTFRLADDPLCLPIIEFRNEIARSGMDPGRFLVLRRGETRIIPSTIR
jgi:L-ascorbate metabolism protein UlaG (beta-lactamase superfamily)